MVEQGFEVGLIWLRLALTEQTEWPPVFFLFVLSQMKNFKSLYLQNNHFHSNGGLTERLTRIKENRLSRTMASQRISPRWPSLEASRSWMCKWLGPGCRAEKVSLPTCSAQGPGSDTVCTGLFLLTEVSCLSFQNIPSLETTTTSFLQTCSSFVFPISANDGTI